MTERRPIIRRHRDLLIGVWLFLGTLALYGPTLSHDYINIDDPDYAAGNHMVKQGVTPESLAWAFTTTRTANWHPLTWLSYMADVHVLGSTARTHHLVNLLFHALNAVVLYIVLRRMTSAAGRSLIVALLFAVHPLNIESVVWIAERKNVLSTLFWLLVMGCYARYTDRRSIGAYLAALILFALGLMAKPMLVTLPCVLLLLDFWPLGRLPASWRGHARKTPAAVSHGRLVGEKIPFFALTTASCIVTFWAQHVEGAVKSLETFPLTTRIANACVSYVLYLKKIFWPDALAIFYPYPAQFSWWQPLGAVILLAALSWMAFGLRAKHPYLLFGWLWYLGTLVPVIGIIQVGAQAMADRYAYIPAIGVFIIATWGLHALCGERRRRTLAAIAAGILATGALATVTWFESKHWQNSHALLKRAIAVTRNNHFAHNNLGSDYAQKGQFDQAAHHFIEALRAKPDYWTAQNNLGLAMDRRGRLAEALDHYAQALQLKPEYDDAHNNMGSTLAKLDRWDEARDHFRRAVQINPRNATAQSNLATALARQGRMQEARAHFQQAVAVDPYLESAILPLAMIHAHQGEIEAAQAVLEAGLRRMPDNASIAYELGQLHHQRGDLDQAAARYRDVIALAPQNGKALNGLARIHYQKQEYDEALRLFLKLSQQFPNHPEIDYNIACVYARQRQTQNALTWLRQAIDKGYRDWQRMKTDPDLESIRHTPAFEELMRNR
ncbi:MAG: tetratricopeptide repeat protein [Desulfobacterales bacterium]|nr:tetratricopeptide repeat protein [Desulfobacterales bacterium]